MSCSLDEDESAMDHLTSLTKKEPKFSYSRHFLLSLSHLDACKKLPTGFHHSLLSEFEDALQDRSRISAGFSSHGFRRNNDYSSSPPTRGDPATYSRGRWDNRSSGRNDKDSDSHSDRDSESGKRYVQSRRSWQSPEHDGLLGSGSFPRPSVPKLRTNDNNNRVNEPYHPPRPYKAAPYSRRDSDSINDETFGDDSTNDDSTEEERKRRAVFESMRKEQHKILQENQKTNVERRKDEFDISTLIDDDKIEKGLATKKNVLDEFVSAGNSECAKATVQSQTLASRPLVPPGFSNATVDKNSGTKTSAQPNSTEIRSCILESKPLHLKDGQIFSGIFGNQEKKSGLVEQQVENNGSNSVDSALNLNLGVTGNKSGNLSDQGGSTTILDKLFGSAMIPDSSATASLVELNDDKDNDVWSPRTSQSSKFARWFSEEDRKPLGGLSSNGLLSLIVGTGESSETQIRDMKNSKQDSSSSPFQTVDLLHKHSSDLIPPAVEISEKLNIVDKIEPAPPALTCEDLEQSMLSELCEKDPALLPIPQTWSMTDVETKSQKPDTDNHASQHLLSLLMKGTGNKETAPPSPKLDFGFSGNLHTSDYSVETKAENLRPSYGEPLALQTLFGNAFMKELQTIRAPVSAQRDPIGSDGLPFGGIGSSISKPNQPKSELASSELGGFNEIREEEILLPGRDRQNLSSQGTPGDIAEKLSALSSTFREERYILGGLEDPGAVSRQGPYDSREPNNFHNPPIHASSLEQLFHPSNINTQMKFMAPEGVILHGTPPNQRFPRNMVRPPFHQQGSGHNGFDPHPILQQMQRSRNVNLPPPHVLQGGFPGGTPPQSNNHGGPGFMPDINPMQGFPFPQQQHNFAGLGIQPRAPEVGSEINPEAMQRLVQMEIGLNSKQMHPPAGRNQGSYNSHGLDMGFGYR
ncbi:hypothetical protein ACFE04_017487 [Oxalis oulophora]